MVHRLSAVILAAGLSSRMGELKTVLPLGTGTVLDRCLELFRDCGVEDLVVVTGHRSDEIAAIAKQAGARPVHNADFASGMYSSIRTGVGRLAAWSDGFFLLPVDIPLVRSGTIRLLSQSFTVAPAQIIYPVFDGKRGHPPLITRDLVPAISKNEQVEGGLRSILAAVEKNKAQQVAEVSVPDANIHFDMDTPADYAAGLRRFNHLGYPTLEESSVILQLHPMPEKGLVHGRLVAAIAVALCRAIGGNGRWILDQKLCRVCGLLHDIAKGNPNHELLGAEWLRQLGFDQAAVIVAAHKDLAWLPGMALTEQEIVHLADKLAHGNRLVDIQERFEEKLTIYQDNPEAVQAINRRYEKARQLAAAVEAESGQRLADIISNSISS